MLTIAKVLNNNIAVVVDEQGNDCIAMGKGIAFQRKHGDVLERNAVERLFTQDVPELAQRFGNLTSVIAEEDFEAARHIVDFARQRLARVFDDGIYLALANHIHFAIKRARLGWRIDDRLIPEIKRVYSDEFACAEMAVIYLDHAFDIELPEDEAGFIALHFVNASCGSDEGTCKAPFARS